MQETDHRIQESPIYQGEDESVAGYYVVTTPWGGSPSSPVVKIYNSDGTDVSSTNLTGSASVSGDNVVLPTVHSLTNGAAYRLEIKFTISGSVVETWADLIGRK